MKLPALLDNTDKPGEYPFTRGLYKEGYRKRLWTTRQYSGFGTAEETNERFKFLLAQGQTGLSLAFDLPTQMGLDSDHPRAMGEVGKVGVAINSIIDMETVLKDIPLEKVSLSMTINATAPILVALLQVVAEKRGISPLLILGTVQNDILKEYIARGTYIFPPAPSMRLATDLIVHCSKYLPKFNPISVSGYHMRDAGCTIEQEMGFSLANAQAYIDSVLEKGIQIDDFAQRISWIFNTQNDFFAEIAKYRALRRIWARLLREKYGAKDPKSWHLRVHVQTGGATLTAQQPENNIVRATLQALASVLGGVQSLALSCYDEAIAIPTKMAQTLALRTQQIIAHETGVTATVDPLGGASYIETLTYKLEKQAQDVMQNVLDQGGVIKAIESGFIQSCIEEASYRYQKEIENGEKIIIGVNKFQVKEEKTAQKTLFRSNPKSEKKTIELLIKTRKERNHKNHEKALLHLKNAAITHGANLMEPILDAARAHATVGEICNVFAGIYGCY